MRCAPSAKQPRQRECGRELRAVDQRQPLFGAKRDGGEARGLQRLGAGHHLAFKLSFAVAHHDRRHMRQRCQIA